MSDIALLNTSLVEQLPGFAEQQTQVDGARLYSAESGTGEPLLLLPGWPQNWWQFHKVMPALAERFHVIALDLQGIGGSVPYDGNFDKKTLAAQIHNSWKGAVLGPSTLQVTISGRWLLMPLRPTIPV